MTPWQLKTPDEVYASDEIASRLQQDLPAWTHEDGHLRRKYQTSGWKGTLMVVNAVGHLAEAAWHHPDLEVSYPSVIVKLMNHTARGITNKDFELAQKIEEVVMWQPAKQAGSALEGTPDDAQYRYIKYE
ncbi:MAG: 4a-hydroxytetrahydrobiopterin dehydratase [Burkholderiales bacterium]